MSGSTSSTGSRFLGVLFVLALAAIGVAGLAGTAQAVVYTWDNSNVTGTPVSPLDWFTGGPNTLGLWTGPVIPVSNNGNTIQFFQDASTALPNTANPSAQTSNINNSGSAFELGILTLAGKASATANANLAMTISGDPLNFSAATGTINLNGVNNTRTLTYNLNSNIQLGTNDSAGALTITGNGSGTFNIGGIISELQAGGGSLIKSGTSTVTLNGSAVNTFTGATTVNRGTLIVDFANLATPTDLINSGNALTLGGGTLSLKGLNNAGSSQTFASTTLSANRGSIITLAKTGTGSMAVDLKAITRNAGSTLSFSAVPSTTGIIATTTNTNTNNILGPWATVGATTTLQYAANDESGNIISYTGATAATPGTLGNMLNAATNYSFAAGATIADGSALTGNTLRYTGTVAGTLEIGTVANNTNTLTLNGLMQAGTNGLTIQRTGTGATGGLVIGSSNELVIAANDKGITISAPIKNNGATPGSVTFSSVGNATLTLSGVNTFTGGLVINSGWVNTGSAGQNNSALGPAGSVNVTINSGATLKLERNTITGNLTLNGGTLAYGNGFGDNWSGLITLGATSIMDSGGTGGLNANADISGPGGLTKISNGNLNLNGTNTYTGPTTVNAGVLQISKPASLYNAVEADWTPANITVASGVKLRLKVGGTGFTGTQAGTLIGNLLTVNNNGLKAGSAVSFDTTNADTTIDAAITNSTGTGGGAVGVEKVGTKTLTLSGASTYTGPTTLSGGNPTIVKAGVASVAGVSGAFGNNSAVSFTGDYNQMDLNGFDTQIGSLIASGTQNNSKLILGANTLTVGGDNTSPAAFVVIISGTGNLTKIGTGTQTLSGASTFSGQLTVEQGGLKVATVNNVSTAGPLGNSALSVILGKAGGLTGTLQYTGATAGSSKPFTMAAGGTGALQVDTGAAILTLSGLIDGDGALAKTGAGTLTLTGENTYGGGTTVARGNLLVNNTTGSGTGAGAVTVANATDSTTATLGGTGTISGAVAVSAPAGTNRVNRITGGDIGTIGTLNISGGLSFEAGAIGYFDITDLTTMDYLAVTGDLTAASGTLIRVPAELTPGTYSIIGYTGEASVIENYTLQDLAGGVNPIGFSLSYGTNVLNLEIAGGVKDCLWNGGGGADVKWSTAANWNQTPSATGDTLVFGTPGAGGATLDNDIVGGSFASLQFASGAPAFTLNGNSVTLTRDPIANVIILNSSANTQTVNLPIALGAATANGTINAASGNIVINGDISGNGSLTKTGTGTLTLSGSNNTYGGGTIINAGAVVVGSLSKLGATTGNLTLGGGSLDLGTTSQTIGAVSITAAAGSGDTISNGSLTGTSYAASNTTGDAVISANLLASGSAGLAKSGGGILTLSGSGNTYTGATTISAGTLKLGVADAIPHGPGKGDVTVDGTLDLNGFSQTTNGLTCTGTVTNGASAAATLTVGDINSSSNFPGAIQDGIGSVALKKIGSGAMTLSGVNTFTGGLVIDTGMVYTGSAGQNNSALGAAGFVNVTVASGATLRLELNTITGNLTLNGGTLGYGNGFGDVWNGLITLGATSIMDSGGTGTLTVNANISGPGGLTKNNNGTLSLNGTNLHSGITLVNAGTLALANVNAVQNSTLDTGTLGLQQVTFTVAGTNTYNIGGLQGTDDMAIGANTISVGANGVSTAYSGGISDTGALAKVGGGTLTLSGSNTYGGGTIVSDGTLLINNTRDSGTGTGAVAVNGGTLGGSGIIGGDVTVNAGGHLAPGDGVGTLTVGTSVAMAADSIYDWEFASSTSADLVVVTGDLALTSGWKLKLAQAEDIKPLVGSKYDLFTYTMSSSPSLAAIIDYSGVTDWPNAQIGQDTVAQTIYLKFGTLGDANGDDVVDAADYIIVKQNFGMTEGATLAQGNFDANIDGNVDWDDLQILMANFTTRSVGEAPAVPEPATLGLLAIGALAVIRRRRK